jgi:hypothetical protein
MKDWPIVGSNKFSGFNGSGTSLLLGLKRKSRHLAEDGSD